MRIVRNKQTITVKTKLEVDSEDTWRSVLQRRYFEPNEIESVSPKFRTFKQQTRNNQK